MAQVLIRNLDEQVIERLKARAAAERKSLEQKLRDVLTEAEAVAARGSGRARSLSCAHSAYSSHACGRRDSRDQVTVVVVDASVALKWFVKEENTPLAVALLASGERAIAPTLIVAELCNAAWRLWRRSEIARAQVGVVAGRAPTLFAALVSEMDLAKRASEISLNLEHPAYDGFYLALAEREEATLVTADRRLAERVRAPPWERRVVALDAWAAMR